MGQQISFCQAAALHERQSAGRAQRARGVGSPSPHRLELDVPNAAEKGFGVLVLERCERAAERVLGPALRVALNRIVEKTIEGGQQLGTQLSQTEFANKVRRFGDDKVVPMFQRLAQWFYAGFRRLLPKAIQCGYVFLETPLAGHRGKCNAALPRWPLVPWDQQLLSQALPEPVAPSSMVPVKYLVRQNRTAVRRLVA